MNELKSYTEYAVSTPTADFVIGFDFNYGEDAVNVTVDDVPATEAGYTVVYLNETTIRLSPSVPSGVVRLQRETDIDQTDHAYRAGAKFIAQTMDENFEQLRHSQQEVRDGFNKLADDTYEIIDTLQEVGQSAQDAADAAEVAAGLANNAAAQVNDKVSYEDFNNKPHNAMLGRDAEEAHPTGAILDASGETQQQINYNGGSKWHSRVGGYKLNERVILTNGDIVKSTIDGNTNDPNTDMTGWRFVDKNTVETISELLTLNNPKDGEVFYVKGFRTPTNLAVANPYKGGGEFTYITSRSAENDGISIFNGWARLNITEVTPEMAGAYANFVDDDEDAIVKAQALARELRVPLRLTGLYAKSKPLVCLPWDTVLGTGNRATRIRKIGNATSGLAARQAAEKPIGTFDTYDVDACLIFYPYDNQYATNITVRDIFFEHGTYGTDPSAGYGLYAPRHAVCNTENLQFDNVLTAFFANNFWNCSHKRLTSVSGTNPDGSKSGDIAMYVYDGDGVPTGTSNIIEYFLFNNYKRAYDINNLQTTEFVACYGENISKNNGIDEAYTFIFVNPHDITLTACGQESCYTSPLYIRADGLAQNCSINLNGFQAVWGTNGTTTNTGINLLTIDGGVTVVSNGSNFRKGIEGVIFDGFFLSSASTLINNGSSFGASSIQQEGSTYIEVAKAVTEKDGFAQKTKEVGADMRNGWEDKFGLTIKPVQGATINIPSGLTDAWGVSAYFGLNASEGVQLFFSTTNDNVYKLRRTGVSGSTAWTIL